VHCPPEVVHCPEAGVKEPEVEGDAENVTVPPVGVTAVPGEVSVTVAVQVVGPVTGIVVGEHEIEMDDALLVAVTAAAPLLVMCNESPL